MAYQTLRVDDELILSRLAPEHALELFEIVDAERERLARWLPWPALTLVEKDSLDFIQRTIKKAESGEEYGFGIISDGQILGHASIMHLSEVDRQPEIGYWIRESAEGKGVTTRAAQALTYFALNTLNFDEVIIRADPANAGSNRIAEKLGYTIVDRSYDEEHKHMYNRWLKHRS